ncbi:unnamed protein product [Pieris brassicae]|uniref:Uncharacterized protein n=1 Tax=Pieris brassicae TaxID=7116 RepID=A0A9P0XFY5_PIEBR|nr:unnamed protein product [Pieris brassicae]
MNLANHVKDPTHLTSHSQSLIGIVFTNAPVACINVEYIPDLGAHAFILTEFKLSRPKALPKLQFRPLKDIDISNHNKVTALIPWHLIERFTDVNKMIDTFNRYIIELFDRFASIKTKVIKNL